MNEPLILALVGIVLLLLCFRFVRGIKLGRRFGTDNPCIPACADKELTEILERAERSGKARESILEIQHRAPGLKSAPLRAAYFCAAGHLSLKTLKRPGLAVGFYLRALRGDPSCVEAMDRLQEILTAQKRIRRLEWTYWEVLGRLSESQVPGTMWLKCWSGLAAVYASSPRTVSRTDAIRKTIGAFDTEEEAAIAAVSNVPKAVP